MAIIYANERDANTPKQIITKWDGKPIPPCPSMVELATSIYRINPVPMNEDDYIKAKRAQAVKELERLLEFIPNDEEQAVTSLALALKTDSAEPTTGKRLRKLLEQGKVLRVKRGLHFYYWKE